MPRRLLPLLVGAAVLVAGAATVRWAPSTPVGHSVIAAALSQVSLGSLGRLQVEGLAGDPWRRYSVGHLTISDRHGVWLDARDVAVRWSPTDLLLRRVRLRRIEAGRIALLRPPPPPDLRPQTQALVSVRIDSLTARMILTPADGGAAGEYGVEGRLDIGRGGDLAGRVNARSAARPGDTAAVAVDVGKRVILVEAHAREAAGGAIGGFLGLDRASPFTLDLTARGDPHAGAFQLSGQGSGRAIARGAGLWSPRGGQADLRVDLTASTRLARWRQALGEQANATLVARRATADRFLVDLKADAGDSAVRINGPVDLKAGRIGAPGLDAHLTIKRLQPLLGAPGLGAARLDGRFLDRSGGWRLTGESTVEQVQAPGFGDYRLTGPFTLDRDANRFQLSAETTALLTAGRAGPFSALLGATTKAAVQADIFGDGRVLIRRLDVKGAALRAQITGRRGLLGDLAFDGTVEATSLVGLQGLTGGRLRLDLKARQKSDLAPWLVSAKGVAGDLRWRDASLDQAFGGTTRMEGEVVLGEDHARIERLSLDARGVRLKSGGAWSARAGGRLTLTADTIAPLQSGGLRLSPGAHAEAVVDGGDQHPVLAVTLSAPVLEAVGGPVPALRDVRGTLNGVLRAGGVGGGLRLVAGGELGPSHFNAQMDLTGSGLDLEGIDASGGGMGLIGKARVTGEGLNTASLDVTLGPGALIPAGQGKGHLEVAVSEGRPVAHVVFTGSNLASSGAGIVFKTLTVSAIGPVSGGQGRAVGSGAVVGLTQAFDAALTWRLQGEALTIEATGGGRLGGAQVRALAPARLVLSRDGDLATGGFSFGRGRVQAELQHAGGKVSGHVDLQDVSLGDIDPEFTGALAGSATISRQGADLVGDAQLRVSGLTRRALVGDTPLSGDIAAALGGGRLKLRADLTDGAGSKAAADLVIPARLTFSPFAIEADSRARISGAVTAVGAIGPVWDLLEGGDRSLSGQVSLNGALGGTLADPTLKGVITLRQGRFDDAASGASLRDLALDAQFTGEAIEISRLEASDPARGALKGAGRGSLQRGGDSTLRLHLSDFRLLNNAQGQALASGDVTVVRAADGRVRLAGGLVLDRGQFNPAPPAPTGVTPMEVVEINRPEGDEIEAANGARLLGPAPPVELDVTLKARSGLFLKGRGLNLEMSVDARVTGTADAPALTGVARVVRGDFDFAGKRFTFDDRGQVRLAARPDQMQLDLTATREDPALTAVIAVRGTAAAPTLTLTSSPSLPRDEILSQVLFGASASQLSGVQAAQLASALAGLAKGGGFDVMGGLRGLAHLDRLAVDSAAASGFSVAGGRYVTDRLYVELSGGPKTGEGAQVEWRILRHLALVSKATSQGDHTVSIRWRQDY